MDKFELTLPEESDIVSVPVHFRVGGSEICPNFRGGDCDFLKFWGGLKFKGDPMDTMIRLSRLDTCAENS